VKARADTARAVALALKLQRDAAMLTPEQQDKLVSEAKFLARRGRWAGVRLLQGEGQS